LTGLTPMERIKAKEQKPAARVNLTLERPMLVIASPE